MSLRVEREPGAMHAITRAARHSVGPDGRVGLVPTMGALHEGHLALVQAARERCDVVAVSIFVNPTQFSPHEDLSKYPRTLEADLALLEGAKVDFVFAPSAAAMYPQGATQTWVDVPEIGARLDGRSRPTHFRGVATVVSKLFHIVDPDIAYFGQKDAAQVAVLRAMVRDLNWPLELIVCPTVREPDGLALSSRNRYLSAEERQQARALSRSLRVLQARVAAGVREVAALQEELQQMLRSAPGVRLDYAEIVDENSLLPVDNLQAGALVAVAAWVGTTRLIDNVLLPASPRPELQS